ncbi:hypothetical protein C5N14_26670 [Micromonospora sp. MW-13]|uniref:hypothetical protein n=1 Tax=Micromonospora sp. MW-13 TaxID=2094022 RepID=UPI000ECE5BD9|nr:hypothetical protein [Micromonospora sp. MW-13]RGC65835.1 hypothetical protein C5N14_26670 [Micromonospora sp. MW-13]
MNPLRISARRLLAVVAVLGLGPVLAVPSAALGAPLDAAGAAGAHPSTPQLLAKAAADECFAGIGQPYPAGPPCAAGQAKVNQSYLWGMTRAGRTLWFGTGANVNCLTSGRALRNTRPTVNADWACEYGESQIAKRNPQLPPILGDHRPPRLYAYDTRTSTLTEKTDLVKAASTDDANRLQTTAGIRAAGNFGGVALLGGPALGESVNLFAFDTDTGAYLGSRNLPTYGNIRHFTVADGALYAGVGVGANGGERGHVLRWAGSKTDPFAFTVVANLPAQAADLTVHEGRVFVTTWPGSDDELAGPTADVAVPTSIAAVWMSPKLSAGAPGLNPEDADGWQQVWNVSSYEPDPVVARAYALGGLASYGGYLYWGTMHVPMKATTVHLATYPPKDETATQATIQNTQRSISIYRGRGFGSAHHQKVDLLYGSTELPAYDPAANGGAGAWAMQSTHQTPKFGPAGFGNPYNNYTWKMVVAGGKLYVGTMDWSYLAKELGQETAAQLGLSPQLGDALAEAPLDAAAGAPAAAERPEAVYGGDLYAFSSPNRPATTIDNSGVGNYLNYGVRNMVTDGSTLYLGMANPMNLRTDPNDDVPEGGWELIRLRGGC